MTDAATPITAAGRAEQLDRLVRDTLGAESSAQWRTGAADRSFIALGGDSLGAVTLVAQAEELLGVSIDFARLLGLDPLAEVLDAAVAAKPAPARAEPPEPRPARDCARSCPGRRACCSPSSSSVAPRCT